MKITIPHEYIPRSYQIPFFEAMDSGFRRACLVWHRRSGKTKTLLNFAVKKAFERIGVYYHCFPEYGQGRKIVWDAVDEDTGKKLIDLHIPPQTRRAKNSTELKIEMVNGSVYQIIGTDNYDSLVGPNPFGLILDEWAVSKKYPIAWQYFMPILAENGGWAVFPYTPRGRNHGFDHYQMALSNKDWFCQLLTVDDTKAVSMVEIQKARDSGMSEDMIQQEFYCSFLASTADILIPFNFIQDALRQEIVYHGAGRIAGVDVARFGDDRTAIVIRQAGQIIDADTWKNLDTTQSTGKIIAKFRAKMFDVAAIDVIGLGAGVYDMMKNNGIPCVAVNVSESPSIDGRFVRLRDELWWKVREWFQDRTVSISKGINEKYRKELVGDIQDIHFSYDPRGLIKIESKDEMKQRLRFSPDLGDALCCTFAPGIEMKINASKRRPFELRQMEEQQEYNPFTYGMQVD